MTRATTRPDILVVLADDLGFSDIGCYGSEIDTPNLDRLGRTGTRFTQFYNSPRCSPSRASLLTGQHPHRVGVGILTGDERPDGYPGNLSDDCVTAPEALRSAGYGTYMSGKWHLAAVMDKPNGTWPTRRGFDRFYGTIDGAGSYYTPTTLTSGEESAEPGPGFFYTDAITDNAVRFVTDHDRDRHDDPLFLYLSYTAPHWPLHASEEDIARYHGRFDAGWDRLREQRLERLVAEGVIDPSCDLTDRDPEVPAWDDTGHHDWETRRMETYAAQITRMDTGIGRVLDTLERLGRLDNTLVLFLSDNGGCAEEFGTAPGQIDRHPTMPEHTSAGAPVRYGNDPGVVPGPEDTFASYGRSWANLSNAPFREYKHWVHEGGIATPFIVHWPAGLGSPGALRTMPRQLVDILPTLLDVAEAHYPDAAPPLPGTSLLPLLRGASDLTPRTLFWEHEGNAGVRRDRWKLVRKYGQDWELYDMTTDRTETRDLAATRPDLVGDIAARYERWADEVGVIPRERIEAFYRRRDQEAAAG
ncbi:MULTISPECIES: arylsulfatase [unclassified Streptomyces]|uniref:arylsulfatase n=1 Tax=unclassified Streptomyces TaxID=2593676 RepID=UPI00278BF18B|nr:MULTISPECIES: arylsulfatase [unclassified Streptomyces]